MANACGRLLGTVLSGWIFQVYGLVACLFISAVFIALAVLFSSLIELDSGDDLESSTPAK